MTSPSRWPLSEHSIRFIAPAFILNTLMLHPLTRDCYPTAMGYYPKALGHRMQRLRPDENLLLYCVDGQGSLTVDGVGSSVGPGDLILLRQGISHNYIADSDEPWTLYWVHFQGDSANTFLDYMGYSEDQLKLYIGASPGLIATFNNLLAVRRTGYSVAAFVNAANQLRQLFTQFGLQSRQQIAEPVTLNLINVQTYMQDNLDQALDLDALASIARLSKYHFSHRYRMLTGYPPIRHFTHMKMEAACRLLDTTERSIKSIAASLAYDDPLYFSRLFRKIIGSSPRQYRASRLG